MRGRGERAACRAGAACPSSGAPTPGPAREPLLWGQRQPLGGVSSLEPHREANERPVCPYPVSEREWGPTARARAEPLALVSFSCLTSGAGVGVAKLLLGQGRSLLS